MHLVHDVERCVDFVLSRVGKRIRLATPLGVGKPIPLLNAFYRRAKADPSIDLHILTALTLQRPRGKSELDQRLLGPLVERVYADYPDPEYELDRVARALPPNVRVIEFYFYAGKYLGNAAAQADAISTNYTFVSRDLVERGVNVIAQQVCRGEVDGAQRLSLSTNPDLTLELVHALREREATFALVGQINDQLPFLHGDAVVEPGIFDCIADVPGEYHRLFGTPKTAIADDEFMIGLYASALVRDGGTLQIGIGAIGDALVYALKLRHEHNALYRELLQRLHALDRFGSTIERIGGLGSFKQGLFASTEMFVDGFMHLIEAGIVKRKVEGASLHAAFLLGPEAFYAWLRDLPEARRREISMRAIGRINQKQPNEDPSHRREARFINTSMMITLLGAAVSDALEDGQIVSGVGGQYNFVALAHALPGAHSILQVRSTRPEADGSPRSNIVYEYGHVTIPRHLRDVVVTDHGIAALRARTDGEVIAAMLAVTDSRFQAELAERAHASHKLAAPYVIPALHRDNRPEAYRAVLDAYRAQGFFPAYPFGSDLTEQERVLSRALKALKDKIESTEGKLELLAEVVTEGAIGDDVRPYLERMGLDAPSSLKEKLYQRLLAAELRDLGGV